MNNRTLLVVVAALAAAVVAVPVGAEESTVDQAQSEPAGTAVREGVRVADEVSQSSIVRAFHEDWETAGDIEASGWSQETIEGEPQDPWRLVHRKDDNPFEGPAPTPIATESKPHAVTVMNEDAEYPTQVESRLVSPELDLRYVRGASVAASEPYRNDETSALLSDLHDAYLDRFGSNSNYEPYHYLLVDPPAQWFPVPCRDFESVLCRNVGDGYQEDEEGRSGYESGERTERVQVDASDSDPFGFFGGTIVDERVTVPVPGTRQNGLYADDDGSIYAPNPVNEREGLTYINLTFWHEWDLEEGSALYLEVRERLSDGSWSDWRHLTPDEIFNNQARVGDTDAAPSSRYQAEESGDRTETYNGWDEDERAFVGSSDGLVASTFNLNRFAGTEIQLGWRLSRNPCGQCPVDTPGWFVDDVVVWTNTYQRDVGVREVERPDTGDRVAPSEPFRPSATVRNYGHLPMSDVKATFKVTPQDDTDTVLWQDTQTLERLDAQEEIEVTATEAFDPTGTGSYRLVANVTPYQAPSDAGEENLTHRPQTAPNDDNDQAAVPFQVQPVPEAQVDVVVGNESVQTDRGTEKRFQVQMENTGNLPLAGAVTVTARQLDRTTLEPVGDAQVLERVNVNPGELPFGTELNSFGAEDANWTRAFTWSKGLDEAGVYRLNATFQTGQGRFSGEDSTFVRATPAPYYSEDVDDLPDVSFDDKSVYSAGFRVDAWTANQTNADETSIPQANIEATATLPDPVSPKHVWYARGDDGGFGTRTFGNSAERAAGADETVSGNGTYESTEPDSYQRTKDSNLVDHYWLTREINLTAHEDADSLKLSFWHTADFTWTGRSSDDQRESDRSRGRVEILPQRNAFLTDPAQETDVSGPDGADAETGVDPVDERTPSDDRDLQVVSSDSIYAQSLATYEDSVPWTRETLDLTPWKGQQVTLRFHLETTADRQRVNASEGGTLFPWLLDNVELTAEDGRRDETVFSSDLEGDNWKQWSTDDGFQMEDPRSPVVVGEGRGWDRHSYGTDIYPSAWHVTDTRKRPEAGSLVKSPMLRWGDPQDREAFPEDINLSILSTPAFSLSEARNPELSFLHNYSFPAKAADSSTEYNHIFGDYTNPNHVTSGGSVWIVAENEDGEEVKRELLTPTPESEGDYKAVVASNYTGESESCAPGGNDIPGNDEIQCRTPLNEYPERENVFTGRSSRSFGETGPARWESVSFDLSPYAEPGNASLDYHLEFHAINQLQRTVEEFGWLVDEVRVTEGTFANDLAVEEVVRPEKDTVGPGLQVPVALRLQNEGLYDQLGVQTSYVVRNATGDVIAGPFTKKTSPGEPIPGALTTENPDKNKTVIFNTQPWETPQKEGQYVLEGRVTLSEALPGNAFPDDNPRNDILRREITVDTRRSVGLESVRDRADDEIVDPFVATTSSSRSFEIGVENKGTLPEDNDVEGEGNFTLDLVVEDPNGNTVFEASRPLGTGSPVGPDDAREVAFRNAWKPNQTGVYEISFQLNHANETVGNADVDNVRNITYTVFESFLPRPGQDIESEFRAEARGWQFQDGSWTFGRGEEYRNGADDPLVLKRPLSLRALRSGEILVNHTYDFERSYDGARLEIQPVGGEEWYPVPPKPTDTGYPVNMSTGSPFVEDPSDQAEALSGTSGGGEEPSTVETSFDVGGVDALTEPSVIFDDDLRRPLDEDGFGPTPSVRRGDWSREPISQVEPHSGDVMFHSNRTTVERSCWLHESENTGTPDVEGSLKCTPQVGLSSFSGYYDSRKYLNVTFDEEVPGEKDPLAQVADDPEVRQMEVVFWDYRAIGLPSPPQTTESQATVSAANEISVKLTCVGDACPEDDNLVLNPAKSGGYDDNYRGWTENVYSVPAPALEPLTGPGKAIRLSFVHHVSKDISEDTRPWRSDADSIHGGWFVDDVSIRLDRGGDDTEVYWSDDLEGYNRTYKPRVDSPFTNVTEGEDCSPDDDSCAVQERLNIGPWDGGWWTLQRGTGRTDGVTDTFRRPLWDPRGSWGEQLWRHVGPPDCFADTTPSALSFNIGGDGERSAETAPVEEAGEGAPSTVSFALRAGSQGGECDPPSPPEDIKLQYRLPGEASWTTVESFDPEQQTSWSTEDVALPSEAETGDTRLRWYQENVSEPRGDEWAVDTVSIRDPDGNTVFSDDFDDESGLDESTWDLSGVRHQGEFPCGPLADGNAETAEGVVYPGSYFPNSTQFRACGPTHEHRDRAGGSRLVTTLNLRPAVDNVTMAFEHKYRFRQDSANQEDLGDLGRSGGRLEVSTDGGESWLPLEPYGTNSSSHKRMFFGNDITEFTHTTLGGREGDPEGNSPYGIGGEAFSGVSGFGYDDGADSERIRYDLSAFAGRKVQVAWHAFFGTHNETDFNYDDQGVEFWAVENVTVDAEVFDGERVNLRLRAATDGSKPAGGWTVNDLTMAGVDTRVNVGTEVLGIPEDAPVEASSGPDDTRDFTLALENNGQTPVRAVANVTVVRESGGERTVAFTEESTVRLRPEVQVERDSLGGTDLSVRLKEGSSYEIRSSVRIVGEENRDTEAIRADNTDVVEIAAEDIRSGSRLALEEVTVSPNNVPKTRDEPVTISAVVVNDGFEAQTTIKNLTLQMQALTAGEPARELTPDDLAGEADLRFEKAFQRKTFTWTLSPSRFRDLPSAVYEVTAEAVKDGSDTRRTATTNAYFGQSFFEDVAYSQPVPDASLDSPSVDDCESKGAAAQDTDDIQWNTVGRNQSPLRSFGTGSFEGGDPNEGNQDPGGGGGGGNPVKGSLICEIENIHALGEELRVGFFTQWSYNVGNEGSYYKVGFTTVDESNQCAAGPEIGPGDLLESVGSSSPGYTEKSWLRKSFRIPDSRLEETTRDEKGCIAFTAKGFGEQADGVYVDDIVVSPYRASVSPDEAEATVQDNTRKRFPFEVRNPGAYNDTFRFAFVDAEGERGNIPRSWDLGIETPEGEPVDTLDLDAGETRTLTLVVDIPVQQVGSISGTTRVPITAISTTEELIRDTSVFTFEFEYPSRPNVKVLGATVNNPDFAAGRPRTVTVTLANVGSEPAPEVPIAITDRMPSEFGQPPRNLTQLGGDPLPTPSLAPGDVTTISAGWTPERSGPHNLTVHLDPQDDFVESNEEDNIRVIRNPIGSARFPDLRAQISVSESEPLAGDTIDVNASITNEGKAPAQGVRVNLRVGVSDLLDGEPPHILGTVIEPGETVALDTTWDASFPGDYQAFLKAFPLSGTLEPTSTQGDNLAVEPVTVRTQALALEAPDEAVDAEQGQDVRTPVTIANRGDRNETVDLRTEAAGDLRPRVTRGGVSVTTTDVPRGGATNVTLEVRAPSQAVAGTYPVTVTAVSQTTGQTETVTVPVRIAADHGLELQASAIDVDPGGGALPLQVTNTGNAPATLNVSAIDLPTGWSLDAPPTRLDPFESTRVDARLEVPTSAPAGVRNFTATAVSAGADASAPVRVDVANRAVVDASLDPSSTSLRPGATVTFQAQLDSVGNVPAFVDVGIEGPDSWTIESPRPQASIAGGDTLAFNVTVDVPEDAEPGTREIRLVAAGQEERFVGNASVEVGVPDATITNVEQNPRVNIESGDEVSFRLTVRNPGSLAIGETGAGLYVDDALTGFGTVTDLRTGGKTEITLNWTAEAGEHVILAVVDPGEDIAEDDEGNNARLLVVQVGGDAQVFGDVQRAVPAPAGLGLVALLAAALGRRWRT